MSCVGGDNEPPDPEVKICLILRIGRGSGQ